MTGSVSGACGKPENISAMSRRPPHDVEVVFGNSDQCLCHAVGISKLHQVGGSEIIALKVVDNGAFRTGR